MPNKIIQFNIISQLSYIKRLPKEEKHKHDIGILNTIIPFCIRLEIKPENRGQKRILGF